MGGVGKGHLIREIDALDGVMGRVADAAAIHYCILNKSRGAAVRGPRAQCDRDRYRAAMQAELARTPGLDILEYAALDVLMDPSTDALQGISTECGNAVWAPSVVITTGAAVQRPCAAPLFTGSSRARAGTFLRGVIHLGPRRIPAGRQRRLEEGVEAPCTGLAATLDRLGFPLGRLTTGTPPRLDGRTIRYECVASWVLGSGSASV